MQICLRKKLKFILTLQLVLFAALGLQAQGLTIKGKVTGDGGESLPGVTILLKGTTTGTVTDVEGNYQLAVPNGNGTLIVSFIGYQNKEVAINNQAVINVALSSDTKTLQEVVVVGYGTQKKETLTGSVTAVKGEEVTKSPSLNVTNNLAGRLPGLTAVAASGEPGNDASRLRIRGLNSFGKSDPLIVVDGVPGRSLERIDPNTIENISVLKDASAAIYGAQAANGVILVTTKRGKVGKPTITASFNQGFGRPTRLPEMADAAGYATMLTEIDQYAGNPPRFSPDDIQKFRDGSDPWGHPNTDWFKEVLKPWSGQNQANVSVSGGSETMKYFVSLTSREQQGYYYNSGAKYNQYDLRSNVDGNITKNISFGVDLAGWMEDRNYPTRSAGSIFRMVMRGKPNLPAYWPDGTPGPDIEYGDNPVVVSTKATGYDRDKRYVANTNFKLNVNIPWVKGLSVSGNAAIDKNFRFQKTWQTPWYLYSWDGQTRDTNGQPVLIKGKKGFDSPALTERMEDDYRILLNGLIKYDRTFLTDHNVNLLVGIEKITGGLDRFDAYRRNFVSTALDQMFAGATDQYLTNGGSGSANARLNYFGRVNYNFKNKYLAEFVWRYQGSYIFEKATRFGFFPGVSLGYNISEEDFWKNNLSFINYFKLRASWGKTGWDEVYFNNVLQEYAFLSTYSLGAAGNAFVNNGGATLSPTLYETGVPNANTTWEKAIQRNVGIDAEFLNNHLVVTADYFDNLRSDILWRRSASIPTSTGMSLPPENIGKSGNRGFDFSVTYNNRTENELTYEVGINAGYAKNRIVFWDETPGRPEYQLTTGRPIPTDPYAPDNDLYYQAMGIFKDQAAVDAYPHWPGARPGDIIFKDVNEDGKIDANDRVRNNKSNIPRLTAGLTARLGYKGFDFSALIQSATGAVNYISTESGEIGNFLQSFYENRWTPDNINASGPRTFNRSNEYWVGNRNTYWLHKTDYIRLKNIELGYSLPQITQKWGIQKLRVYVNAFNLLTYSPDYKDFDPELSSGSGQGYPLQKIVNGGISVTF
ncbi:SusC/RagA family TonB-linked outer membrane protein [Adhaeribacter arboris]|uniref:SusC/RagA family TonB-linked outer membrane protein n=1 Tax=Adhaeribacter arboris TaxID=2072846 RepID=A0A2T2YDD0_9BACT|nr:TonB-dependent receptor [Adhaeribacter arboris]PSR53507.1 SusC/RagA family TonB-linked outer membrane protein [Adhaeribacter arboris]